MKNSKKIKNISMSLALIFLLFLAACSNEDNGSIENAIISDTNVDLSPVEEEALLFMMEEERLARDVYERLFVVWGLNQFQNIAISEQSLMDSVESC